MSVKYDTWKNTVSSLSQSLQRLGQHGRFTLPGVLIAAGLLILLLLRIGYGYHAALRNDIEAKRRLYEASAAMLADAGRMEDRLKRARGRIEDLEKGLLPGTKPPVGAARLQEEVKSLADRSGVTISSSRVLSTRKEGIYTKVPVEFRFRGGLPGVLKLLYGIRSSPILMGVGTLRIKALGDKNPQKLDVVMLVEGVMKSG